MARKFEKFTEEIWEECANKGLPLTKRFVERVENQIKGDSNDYEYELIQSVVDCESPMEQLMSIAMLEVGVENINSFNPFIDVVVIEKQSQIVIEGKTYYADFMLPVSYYKKTKNGFEIDFTKEFIVEVDGHEFHQKTKEQVEHDNERERALQKAGYEVIRFSGTEVYHKAYRCACDVKRIIMSKCNYKVES